jgi:hypothetical protein
VNLTKVLGDKKKERLHVFVDKSSPASLGSDSDRGCLPSGIMAFNAARASLLSSSSLAAMAKGAGKQHGFACPQ